MDTDILADGIDDAKLDDVMVHVALQMWQVQNATVGVIVLRLLKVLTRLKGANSGAQGCTQPTQILYLICTEKQLKVVQKHCQYSPMASPEGSMEQFC